MVIADKLRTTPPPLICLAALALGLAFNRWWPLALIPTQVRYVAGGLLMLGPVIAMPGILRSFRRVNTPFDVRKSPTAFVSGGLYAFSRNPSYVALLLFFTGVGVVLSNAWVPIWLVPAAVIIDRYVIPEEERRLERVFGEQYRAYASRVRRWL